MSKKQQLCVTIDPNVRQYLKQSHINASGLTNKLLKKYMRGEIDL